MARKKKSQVKASINNNATVYSGKVSIKLTKGNKLYKKVTTTNAGGDTLFKFLISCLRQEFLPTLAPRYIQLFHDDELVSGTVAYNDYVITADYKTITFSFLVPYASFSATQAKKVNKIELKAQTNIDPASADNGGYCAQIIITDPDDQFYNEDNTNVVIDWTLSLENSSAM